MAKRYNGTTVQWYNGTMVQRYNGTTIQCTMLACVFVIPAKAGIQRNKICNVSQIPDRVLMLSTQIRSQSLKASGMTIPHSNNCLTTNYSLKTSNYKAVKLCPIRLLYLRLCKRWQFDLSLGNHTFCVFRCLRIYEACIYTQSEKSAA